MKWKLAIVIGIAAGIIAATVLRQRRKNRRFEISSADLGFQEHSPEELASEHLLDLNTAGQDDLLRLGLDEENAGKIVENRPYRTKLDLLSRMVLPESIYNEIKHHIGVTGATQPIKASL
jgi:DNA uptake protein ComE-like DNA-binding protein